MIVFGWLYWFTIVLLWCGIFFIVELTVHEGIKFLKIYLQRDLSGNGRASRERAISITNSRR